MLVLRVLAEFGTPVIIGYLLGVLSVLKYQKWRTQIQSEAVQKVRVSTVDEVLKEASSDELVEELATRTDDIMKLKKEKYDA